MMVKSFAPAKINLSLHVTGQRADGYHLLDSLVAFADVGDRITVMLAEETSLDVTGPMAEGVPTDASNLVMRAAALWGVPMKLLLDKQLPPASGIGGGSSDAAATLMAIADLLGKRDLPEGALALGADVRVCLERRAARMRGVGEEVEPIDWLPALPAVLANPRLEVATPAVFKALETKDNPPMGKRIPRWRGTWSAIDWIAQQRNDLEAPARSLVPEIGEVLEALRGLPGARLARMSGSGATCFALFEEPEEARAAAESLAAAQPGWWVTATILR